MKKLLALSLVFTLLLASCGNVGDSSDTDDAVITESRAVSDSETVTVADTDDAVPTIDDYVNGDLPLPAMGELQLLGDNMKVERFDDRNCAVLYNEHGAWIFDYELAKVTPTVDLYAMLTYVEPTGKGWQYFEDVRIEYEFKETDYEIKIVHNVISNTEPDSHFSVNFHYRTYRDEYRGQNSGYGMKDGVVYPGYTEPLTISSVDEFDKLFPEIYVKSNFLDIAKAFAENDVPRLEELLRLESGALADWEGTVIGDYTISREMPLGGDSWCSMEFTIEHSTIERYPAGRYVMYEKLMHKVRLGGEDLCFALPIGSSPDAITWAYSWGTMYGGYMALDKQDPTATGFAHGMLDYLMGIATRNGEYGKFTGDMYREYAEKYLGIKNFSNEYTAYADRVINHGAHGPNAVRGEIVDYRVENGVHYVTVSCYAEDEKLTVTQTHTYTMVEAENGVYAIIDTEEVYESGLSHFGWAV